MISARYNSSRKNKLWRAAPTPPPEELVKKERGFVLDCNAVSSISCDYSKANPKFGPVIPPYNSQKDPHVSNYFNFHGVMSTLQRADQLGDTATSIEGKAMDFFHERGHGHKYLDKRNMHGAGHSRDEVGGHGSLSSTNTDVIGYNGYFGFRRNIPTLRNCPSAFGVPSRYPVKTRYPMRENYFLAPEPEKSKNPSARLTKKEATVA